jgi:hypothetical protein
MARLPPRPRPRTFYETVQDAVADVAEHGFVSEERLAYWSDQLRRSARSMFVSEAQIDEMLREALRQIYRREIERGGIVRLHPGVGRYTLAMVVPELRAELDRRILASANFIKLNRAAAIEKTLQRFLGWATSIPAGGTGLKGARAEAKEDVKKSMRSLPFEERRVLIDQGMKFNAALSDIVSRAGGAIAAEWYHIPPRPSYQSRPEHLARNAHVFAIRDSWAHEKGLIRAAKAGYTDEVDQPAQLVYCSCKWVYRYHLRDLPAEMLTAKGRAEMQNVRVVA